MRIGRASATGDRDKQIVRRYIRRKLTRIKYCYEKQLLVRPGLEGTVVTTFRIEASGAVVDVEAEGIDEKVSGCIEAVIGSIKYPEAATAGTTEVSYPFEFTPTGG